MPPDTTGHHNLIAGAMLRLGFDPNALLDYAVLPGGISGSHTYRLRFPHDDLILKLTAPDSAPFVVERAAREISFYRELAAWIPLCVPRVIALETGPAAGSAILLAACEPTPPASLWSSTHVLEMAGQLGRFHATFWNKTGGLSTFHWLRQPRPATSVGEIRAALGAWQRLCSQARFATTLTEAFFRWLSQLLERIEAIDGIVHSLPPTLCHGDCHTANLLRAPSGELIWADWQEVGIGRGPEDLSFFFQRATADGAAIDTDAVTATYHAALQAGVGAPVDLDAIHRVTATSELRTRLLYWPAYLTPASTEQVAGVVDRLRLLARQLQLDS